MLSFYDAQFSNEFNRCIFDLFVSESGKFGIFHIFIFVFITNNTDLQKPVENDRLGMFEV